MEEKNGKTIVKIFHIHYSGFAPKLGLFPSFYEKCVFLYENWILFLLD